MNKEMRKQIGQHLVKMITKASTGMGEDGTAANLTRAEILKDILRADFLTGQIYDWCKKVDVSDKANGLFMNVAKETKRTRADGILGGFQSYYVGEGDNITFSNAQFDQTELTLNQIGIICRVTNALVKDSVVLTQYLGSGLEESIKYRLDYEILYGSGATGCNGILNTGDRATKYVVVANPITIQNLKDMVKWYYGSKNGIWVMSADMWYEVQNLYANTLPLVFNNDGTATLFGFPVCVKDNMKSRSIVLGDFTQYLVAQKPLREEVSDQLYFNSNESVFRTIIRINGMPLWYAPITTESGQLVYPFVATSGDDTRSSSSSSSSMDSSSSSSKDSSSSSSTNGNSGSSSSSSSSSQSSSSSSSSQMVDGCLTKYCASTFATTNANGSYEWNGSMYNAHPVYDNGDRLIWFATEVSRFVLSNSTGQPSSEWVSYASNAYSCPDGTWVSEDGSIAEGSC